MLRRFFLSAVPSAVALAATAAQPAAAADQNSTPTTNGRLSFPEPDPIVVDTATSQRARQLLDAVARGAFNRSELAPQLDAFLPVTAFATGEAIVSALGKVQSMFPFERQLTAQQTSTYFRVRYPAKILTWVISVDADNRITGLSLRRDPTNRLFDVTYRRDVQY